MNRSTTAPRGTGVIVSTKITHSSRGDEIERLRKRLLEHIVREESLRRDKRRQSSP